MLQISIIQNQRLIADIIQSFVAKCVLSLMAKINSLVLPMMAAHTNTGQRVSPQIIDANYVVASQIIVVANFAIHHIIETVVKSISDIQHVLDDVGTDPTHNP